MTQPFLSLCVVTGQDDVGHLAHLLTSALNRKTGPLFDEVSIYWNDPASSLPDAFRNGTYWETEGGQKIPLLITFGHAKADRIVAKNAAFNNARGVWRATADPWDRFVSPPIPSLSEDARPDEVAPVTAASVTLRDMLGRLPPKVNSIWLPHTASDPTRSSSRTAPKNHIVRWEDGWTWAGVPEESIIPVRRCTPTPVFLAGLCVTQTRAEKDIQTISLVAEMEATAQDPTGFDHTTFYGIAKVLAEKGNNHEALQYLTKALDNGPELKEAFVYHVLATNICGRSGLTQEAKTHAWEAINLAPERPESYIELVRVAYMAGDKTGCVHWLERARTCASVQNPLRDPLAFAFAANAYLTLERTAEAEDAARIAKALAPNDFFVHATLERCIDATRKKDIAAAYATLAEALMADKEVEQAEHLILACPAKISQDEKTTGLLSRMEAMVGCAGIDLVPADTLPDQTLAALGISGAPDTIIGAELAIEHSPERLLEKIEKQVGDRSLWITVPDASKSLPAIVENARRTFTPERLHTLLKKRGRLHTLRSQQVRDDLPGDYRLVANYTPGPSFPGCWGRKKTIAFWCPYQNNWNCNTPYVTSLYKPEEAVIFLSEALASAGYQVDIFADLHPQDRPLRVDKDVHWRSLEEFQPEQQFDHLILHRVPWGPGFYQFAAKHVWVGHHDFFYPTEKWNPELAKKAKHIYASNWQRRILEESIGSETNGIVLHGGVPAFLTSRIVSDIALEGGRNSKAVVYATSPTRGLARVLELWPEIQQEEPDAALHYFYILPTCLTSRGAGIGIGRIYQNLKPSLSDSVAAGMVTDHGRVGLLELIKAQASFGVFVAPSAVPEVDAQTLNLALACGLRVVSTTAGSIEETLLNQTYVVPEASSDEEWASGGRDRFKGTLLRALSDPEETYNRTAIGNKILAEASWETVAANFVNAMEAAERGDDAYLTSCAAPDGGYTPYDPKDILARLPTNVEIARAVSMETMLSR